MISGKRVLRINTNPIVWVVFSVLSVLKIDHRSKKWPHSDPQICREKRSAKWSKDTAKLGFRKIPSSSSTFSVKVYDLICKFEALTACVFSSVPHVRHKYFSTNLFLYNHPVN